MRQKPTVDDASIRAALTAALGHAPDAHEVVPTLEDNLVVRVRIRDETFYAKFDALGSIVSEAYAYRAAASVGVPVPEVLAIIEEPEDVPSHFVMRAATGVPARSLDESLLPGVWRQLGEALRALHTVPVEGSGGVDVDELRASGRWCGVGEWNWGVGARAGLTYLLERGFIVDEERAALVDELDRRMPDLDALPTVLLNTDLDSGHAFADPASGALTEVLDFGDVMLGSPVWDFVSFAVHEPAALPDVVEGYGADLDQVRPLIAIGSIARVISVTRWLHERDHEETLNWVKAVKLLAADPARAERFEQIETELSH